MQYWFWTDPISNQISKLSTPSSLLAANSIHYLIEFNLKKKVIRSIDIEM